MKQLLLSLLLFTTMVVQGQKKRQDSGQPIKTLWNGLPCIPLEITKGGDTIRDLGLDYPSDIIYVSPGWPNQQELPKEKFIRVDTSRGIVSYYNSAGKKTTKATALDSVFLVSYWQYSSYNVIALGVSPKIKTREDSIRFRIYTPYGNINLNKNYTFIPNDKLQD